MCGSRRGGASCASAAGTVVSVDGGAGSRCHRSACEIRGRHCHGGGRRRLRGWSRRLADAAAEQAPRETAAAVVLVERLAGGAERMVAAAAGRDAKAQLPRWWKRAAGRVAWAGCSCRGGSSCTGSGYFGQVCGRLGGRWLPRWCGMHWLSCQRGGRGPLGRWPGLVAAAAAVQTARATAASVVFVGGWAG